nr:hypothetical protein [Tanacetum cinerariifolium]
VFYRSAQLPPIPLFLQNQSRSETMSSNKSKDDYEALSFGEISALVFNSELPAEHP